MIPLGQLNGKNGGTIISPWIVTMEALISFQTALPTLVQEAALYLVDVRRSATTAWALGSVELRSRLPVMLLHDMALVHYARFLSTFCTLSRDRCPGPTTHHRSCICKAHCSVCRPSSSKSSLPWTSYKLLQHVNIQFITRADLMGLLPPNITLMKLCSISLVKVFLCSSS